MRTSSLTTSIVSIGFEGLSFAGILHRIRRQFFHATRDRGGIVRLEKERVRNLLQPVFRPHTRRNNDFDLWERPVNEGSKCPPVELPWHLEICEQKVYRDRALQNRHRLVGGAGFDDIEP